MKWLMACDGSGYTSLINEDCPGSFVAIAHPYEKDTLIRSCQLCVGGSSIHTTNNQMELSAVVYGIEGFMKMMDILHLSPDDTELEIIVDSQYVYCGFNAHPTAPGQGYWYSDWKNRRWRKKDGKTPTNLSLWHDLNNSLDAIKEKGVRVSWKWTAGHTNGDSVEVVLNDRVDKACTNLVENLIDQRKVETTRSGSSDYQGESAWYKVDCVGSASVLLGIDPHCTPKMRFDLDYSDLFDCDIRNKIVTVNLVGVMGIGLALQFKQKYPQGFNFYTEALSKGSLSERKRVVVWKSPEGHNYFLVATKNHWRANSTEGYVIQCAHEIRGIYDNLPEEERKGLCMPKMGCGAGNLKWAVMRPKILRIMGKTPMVIFE